MTGRHYACALRFRAATYASPRRGFLADFRLRCCRFQRFRFLDLFTLRYELRRRCLMRRRASIRRVDATLTVCFRHILGGPMTAARPPSISGHALHIIELKNRPLPSNGRGYWWWRMMRADAAGISALPIMTPAKPLRAGIGGNMMSRLIS